MELLAELFGQPASIYTNVKTGEQPRHLSGRPRLVGGDTTRAAASCSI
jgi:hypothetical protein